MKKILLSFLILCPALHAQPNHFKAHSYMDQIKVVLAHAKELVKAHPYASVTLGVATLAAIYWYANLDEDDDVELSAYYLAGKPCERGELRKPGWFHIPRPANFFKKQTETPSPKSVSPDFKDFTGEFPPRSMYAYPQQVLHHSEFRHN